MSKDSVATTPELTFRPLIVAASVVGGACVLFAVIMMSMWYDKPDQRGIFGDMFGALNTMFSGLAFAGVIYAILLQRQELRLQRLELEQTREELSRQSAEMSLQNDYLFTQESENRFFRLLASTQEIVDGTRLRPEQVGRLAFAKIATNLIQSLKEKLDRTLHERRLPTCTRTFTEVMPASWDTTSG